MTESPNTPRFPQAPGNPVVEKLRARLASGVTQFTTGSGPVLDYSNPPGDPGLFGPDSVCWRVHSDFTAMMVGGIRALLMQSLHPLAMAGVWDHSSFREDILGRLRRTATFIAGTTYGSRADALALIERVKRIHAQVTGRAPDGRHYRADDPALLTWVHVAEVSSFLAAHLRYVNPLMSPADQDRYYLETALIARALGAIEVPESSAEIEAYLQSMRPELKASEYTAEVVRVLFNAPVPRATSRPAATLMMHSGVDLLPDWAQRMLDLDSHAGLRRAITRPGVRAIAPVMRWALRNGVSKRARQRVAQKPQK